MSTVKFDGASGYLARAKTQRGGVLLLPTIFGVNPFTTELADSYAERGLTTLVWDPYPGAPLPVGYEEAVPRGQALRDATSRVAIAACVDFMTRELRLATVGTIGFCLGGRYVLTLAARDRRIAACVSVYPTIHEPLPANQDEDAVARAADIACPVLLTYPGRDHITSSASFNRLQKALQQREAPTTIMLFPQAEHGYMHNESKVDVTATRHTRPLLGAFLEACLT